MNDGPPPSVAVGSKLGPYVIVRALDAGGMGEVYEARDTRLDRHIALKVVRRELASDPARRQRLEREARAAAALNHPHVVTLHSLEEQDGVLFFTMELIDGATLGDVIPKDGLPCDHFLRAAIPLVDAVAAAHGVGIIHRDLKSANVMITRAGGLKVLDFGLSKYAVDETATVLSTEPLTASGMLVGTAPYMAPEVIEGHEADTRSDIFSLGIILFEMATGRRPFGGETPLATISSILRDASPLASDLNPAVPLELAQIIDGCLAKEPARRRQSASDLRTDLENLAARLRSGEPARLPESSRLRSGEHFRSFRPKARRTLLIGAGAAVALSLLAFAIAWNHLADSGTVAPSERSLAILPLQNLSGDPQQAYFSEGMTDALITSIARINGLRVVPRAAVMKFQDTGRHPAEIARELGVDALLEGTIVRRSEQVRIAVNLFDSRTNRVLWAESYERGLRDVRALENDVALAIAGELRVRLAPGDRARLASPARPVHPTAYDRYLRGATSLQHVNRSDVEAGITALEEAVQLDPYFADAFGALASGYWLLYNSYRPDEAGRLEPKARAAVDKALALDPESAEALAVQGDLLWDPAHGWRHEDAIQANRRALALNPNLARSISRLATLYNHVGLPDLAARELVKSDESPAVLFQKGLAFRIQGRDDLALASWLAIPTASRNTNHLGHLAWILADLGRPDEAWKLLREIPPGTVDVNGMLSAAESLLYAAAGERQQAERRIAAATLRASATAESHHATYLVAAAYARIGIPDESLRWLRFTAANGFPCYPLMERDTNLRSLHSYPPFVQFLDEAKSRWTAYRTRLTSN